MSDCRSVCARFARVQSPLLMVLLLLSLCLLWWSVVEHDNGSGRNKITKQDRIGQDRNQIFVIYCVLRYCGLHGAILFFSSSSSSFRLRFAHFFCIISFDMSTFCSSICFAKQTTVNDRPKEKTKTNIIRAPIDTTHFLLYSFCLYFLF